MTRRGFLFIWGPALLQMAVIFGLSSLSDVGPLLPPGVSNTSGHSIGYAILGALVLRALAGGRLSRVTWGRSLAAIVLCTLYGISDEFHQAFVPGRTPDRADVLADCAGAAVAVALVAAVEAARRWGILGFSPRSDGSD